MLSPPALGSSRRVNGANGEAPGSRRSSQEALWGRLSSPEPTPRKKMGFGGLSALGSSRHLGSPEGFGGRRTSVENIGAGRAPTLGAAAKRGSFFMPEAPRSAVSEKARTEPYAEPHVQQPI